MVRALALRSRDPVLKILSDHFMNLILVDPGSTSLLHLKMANTFASGQLGFLTVVVVVSLILFHWSLKAPKGEKSIKIVSITLLAASFLSYAPTCAIQSNGESHSIIDWGELRQGKKRETQDSDFLEFLVHGSPCQSCHLI